MRDTHDEARKTKLVPPGTRCEEVTGVIGDDTYIHCGATAVVLIQHRGRTEGPYFMCLRCGDHNLRHRDAELLAGELK